MRLVIQYQWIIGIFLPSLLVCEASDGTSQITLNTNTGRYDNILISISKNINESTTLIENIKKLFTEASKVLKTATINAKEDQQRGLTFGKIFILLPDEWNSGLFQNVESAESFQQHSKADFVIDSEGGRTFTHQPNGCGRPGIRTTLPKMLVDELNYDTTNADKIVVQEWAKLRWGVFKETSKSISKQFYFDAKGNIIPNVCTGNVKGSIQSTSDNYNCSFDSDKRQMSRYCKFVPDKNENTSQHSLMSYTQVKSIVKFCDKWNHNSDAKTLHNSKCDRKSIWEVMKQHTDFGAPTPDDYPYQPPEFVLIQNHKDRDLFFQIIVDCSGSMGGNSMNNLKISLNELFSQTMIDSNNNKLKVGLVTFESTANTVIYPTAFSESTRQSLLASFSNLVASGGTALSDGVVKAFEDLGGQVAQPEKFNEDAVFLLLSDGAENEGTYVLANIIPIFEKTNIQINTITYGSAVPPDLKRLVDVTGGKDYPVDQSRINELLSSLSKILNARTKEAQQLVTVTTGPLPPPSISSNIIWQGPMDSSVGQSTAFYFTFPSTVPQIQIESPRGTLYDRSRGSDVYVQHGDKLVVKIPGIAEPGIWTVRVINHLLRTARSTRGDNTPGKMMLMSKSKPGSENNAIHITSYMSKNALKMLSTDRILVHVWVGRNFQPLLGANVVLSVKRIGNDKQFNIIIRDNGIGPDAMKNDGYYSGYVVESMFQRTGLYKIDAIIKLSTVLNDGDGSSFERVHEIGGLRVFPAMPGSQRMMIPPGQVADVQAHIVDANEKMVLLEWTSLGAEGDQGNVSNYTIRLHSQPQLGNVNADSYSFDIITPNWIPKPPYEHEQVLLKIRRTINSQSNVFVVFFFVQAHGPDGLTAPMPFPASVLFTKPNFPSGIKFSASKP